MEKIGQHLLDQHISDERCSLSSSSQNIEYLDNAAVNSLYVKCEQLSQLLKSVTEEGDSDLVLPENDYTAIRESVEKIIAGLENLNKGPSKLVGPGGIPFQAYRIIVYAMQLMLKTNHDSQKIIDLESENKNLQKQLAVLQKKYDEQLKSTTNFQDNYDSNLTQGQLRNTAQEQNPFYEHLVSLLQNNDSNENNDSDSKISDESLQTKYNTVINELMDAHKQNDELLKENSEIEKDYQSLRAQYNSAVQQIKQNENVINGLNAQLQSLRKELNSRIGDSEKADHQLLVTDTEKQVVQMQYEELQNIAQKRKMKINDLKAMNSKLQDDNKSISKKNATLNMELQKLEFENGELQRNLQNIQNDKANLDALQAKDRQISKLQKAMDLISANLESTNSELTEENAKRTQMQSVVQKQNEIIAMLEKQLDSALIDKKNLEEQKISLENENCELNQIKTTKECTHIEVARAVLNYIKDELPLTNLSIQLEGILTQSGTTTTEKVVSAFATLLNSSLCSNAFTIKMEQYNADMESLKEQNTRLVNYVANMVQFIDHVSNSSEIQEWLLSHAMPEDFRTKLAAQAARVEAYLQANKLLEGQQDLCDSFAHFPAFIDKKLNKVDIFKSADAEALVLLEQFSLANSILTKYASELQNRSLLLMAEMRQLRDEMADSEASTKDEIESKTHELEYQISCLEHEKEELQRRISNAKEELRKPDENNHNSLKLLQILNDTIEDDSEMSPDDYYSEQERYTQRLEQNIIDLNEIIQKKDEEKKNDEEKYENEINELKSQLEKLNQENNSLSDKLSKGEKLYAEQIDELHSEIDTLQATNEKYSDEISKLKELVAEELEHNKQLIDAHEDSMKELQEEIEERHKAELMKVGDEIDKLHNLINKKEEETTELIKQARQQCKEEVAKANKEREEAEKHSDEITQNYEVLVNNLKQKLDEMRQNEDSSTKINSDLQKANKELSDQLAEIRVDFKMLAMKYKSLEEKGKREKQASQAQVQMSLMANEAALKKKMSEAENAARESFRNFLINVCEKFSSFVDFSKPIDEVSVNELLDRVSSEIDNKTASGNTASRKLSEYSDAQALLGINDNDSIVKAISNCLEKCHEYENIRGSIEVEHTEVKDLISKVSTQAASADESQDWMDWAIHLHGVISDSYALTKKPSELRFAIGEAVMSSLGKKRMWRHMEILRSEKAIFANGLDRQKIVNPRPTMSTLIAVLAALRRVQKMSGHMHSPIGLPHADTEKALLALTPKKPKASDFYPPVKKNWPLLNPK